MNYTLDVDIAKVREDAEELYGAFYCSEAIVSAIRTNFQLYIPEEVISMASGFPVGIGGSKCVCGAVSGGIMALGLFFGRTQPGDPKIGKMMGLAAELHDWFKVESGNITTN